jgi:uncharacterized protein YqgV (UPF0045/DUF77 family)
VTFGLIRVAYTSAMAMRQEHLSPAIEAVTRALELHELQPEVGTMSTQITGDADSVFVALEEAFRAAAATGHVVMTLPLG